MGLRKSVGNMYPWVTHVHSHLRGGCPHGCAYCYVRRGRARRHYVGPLWLKEDELEVSYGAGKVVFVEHCTDLFAERVRADFQASILRHCREYPGNRYVFQTKNPAGMVAWREAFGQLDCWLGVTVETNRVYGDYAGAPLALERLTAATWLPLPFVSIEPIMDFDEAEFMLQLGLIHPRFVSIGADSKGNGLPEPPWAKVERLIGRLTEKRIEVRLKPNLERLRKGKPAEHAEDAGKAES